MFEKSRLHLKHWMHSNKGIVHQLHEAGKKLMESHEQLEKAPAMLEEVFGNKPLKYEDVNTKIKELLKTLQGDALIEAQELVALIDKREEDAVTVTLRELKEFEERVNRVDDSLFTSSSHSKEDIVSYLQTIHNNTLHCWKLYKEFIEEFRTLTKRGTIFHVNAAFMAGLKESVAIIHSFNEVKTDLGKVRNELETEKNELHKAAGILDKFIKKESGHKNLTTEQLLGLLKDASDHSEKAKEEAEKEIERLRTIMQYALHSYTYFLHQVKEIEDNLKELMKKHNIHKSLRDQFHHDFNKVHHELMERERGIFRLARQESSGIRHA